MSKYSLATGQLKELVGKLVDDYHPEVRSAGVRIELLWAYGDRDDAGEIKSPAIMHNGYQAHGLCKVLGLPDRAAGYGDVRIILDHDFWQEASENMQKALLDHELEHIQVTDKRDDLGRPVIKMKKHDIQAGWFSSIAERWKDASLERLQAKVYFDRFGQAFWPDLAIDPNRKPSIAVESRPVAVAA